MTGDFQGSSPEELIPADVRMISGCQDAQTSAGKVFLSLPIKFRLETLGLINLTF